MVLVAMLIEAGVGLLLVALWVLARRTNSVASLTLISGIMTSIAGGNAIWGVTGFIARDWRNSHWQNAIAGGVAMGVIWVIIFIIIPNAVKRWL